MMEVLSCHGAPCCHHANSKHNFLERSSSPHRNKISAVRKHEMLYVTMNTQFRFSRHSDLEFSYLKNIRKDWASRSRRLQSADWRVFSASDSYVIDDEEALQNVSKVGEPVTKVLIPGLPNDSNGDHGAQISSCFWEWKPKYNVHYETSGSENVNSPPVLFLPGFGVGSFHYEKQLKDLGRDYRVWAMDFLGQGMSLPSEDPTYSNDDGDPSRGNLLWGFGDNTESWADELVYSIDLWRDQVQYFVEEVIKEPVYIVGNSLGGYVGLYFAAGHPELVKGVTLLNATPFWGFVPNPIRSPTLARIFPWAGTFPLPARVRKLIDIVWQKISEPESIAKILEQVYADHSTNVDAVFSRIIETTRHPAAAASFASIMCAPQAQMSFGDALSRCRASDLPICLMYGKEDPWVRPIWGLQVKSQLPDAPYYEMSPAGHCPHDEVPEVVNYLLRGWIKNLESHGAVPLPLLDYNTAYDDNIAKDLEFCREGGSKKSISVRLLSSRFNLWKQVGSFVRSRLQKNITTIEESLTS